MKRAIGMLIAGVLTAVQVGGCTGKKPYVPPEPPETAPVSNEPPARLPSQRFAERVLHKPPALTGSGETAQAQATAFLDWASLSTPQEQQDGRRALAAASANNEIARALFDAAMAAERTDHSRALMALALLGEMRNRAAEPWLCEFVRRPLPRQGTLADGEIAEQTALATLQAKAIDGLAYLNSESANLEVLRAVAEHTSRIVRAEAINAYLWNHRDTQQARATVRRYVRKGEEIFLDRVRRESGESAHSFNGKLEAYLKAHPEVQPPAPKRHRDEPVGGHAVRQPPQR